MGWSDRDWDDWVRGQPGTFWGNQKQQLQNAQKQAEGSPYARTPAGAGRTGGQGASLRETLHGLFVLGGSGTAAYLVYDRGAEWWIVAIVFLIACGLVHAVLNSSIGQYFLSAVRILVIVAFLCGLVWVISAA